MSLHSIAVAGLRPINQITPSHTVQFRSGDNGLAIAVQILSSSISGAPVVDQQGKCIGFISEFDILNALESERELGQLVAEDLMVPDHITIDGSTTIAEAVSLMKEKHILILPIEENGRVTHSVTRKDLLRAWIGLGLR